MLNPRTLKHFKLFRDPFVNDIREKKDIYLSQEHVFLREMLLDAARYQGFVAAYGGVGCGKSTIRKLVIQTLMTEGVQVIYPVIIDKSRIYPGSLLDAIIFDISEEKPKRTLEQKTRQALNMLKCRTQAGLRQALFIEESHMLVPTAFKAVKQLYELEDGFKRMLGIILIGQNELMARMDETRHPELREVSRRVTLAEITGLSDEDLPLYLKHKFIRIGKKADEVFADDAYAEISRYFLMKKDNKRARYPLNVHRLTAGAMNFAAELGEKTVTAEVIRSL